MFRKKYAPFFKIPLAYVVGKITKKGDLIEPKLKIENEALYVAIGLAKKGYYNGDPEKVLNAPVSMIKSIEKFEKVEVDYIEQLRELNNGGR
jgi:hypothetical protein